MLTQYDKAIAAFVTVAGLFLAKWGFDIRADPELQAAVTTLLTTIVVFLVPNKPAT